MRFCLVVIAVCAFLPTSAVAAEPSRPVRVAVSAQLRGDPGRTVSASLSIGRDGRARGTVRYHDRPAGLRFASEQIDSLLVGPDLATTTGTGTGTFGRQRRQPFRLRVEEGRPPVVSFEVGPAAAPLHRAEGAGGGVARLTGQTEAAPAPRQDPLASALAVIQSGRAALDPIQRAHSLAMVAAGVVEPPRSPTPTPTPAPPLPPALAETRIGRFAMQLISSFERAQDPAVPPTPMPWQERPVLPATFQWMNGVAESYRRASGVAEDEPLVVSDGGWVHLLANVAPAYAPASATALDLGAAQVSVARARADGTLGPLDDPTSETVRRAAHAAIAVASKVSPAGSPPASSKPVLLVISEAPTARPSDEVVATLIEPRVLERVAFAAAQAATQSPSGVVGTTLTFDLAPLPGRAASLAATRASAPPASALPLDEPVPGGRFYRQAGGDGVRGFSVRDDSDTRLYAELQRLGGVDLLGYPISHRFVWDGHVSQAFQRAVLRWRADHAELVDVVERVGRTGGDGFMLMEWQVPPRWPIPSEDRLAWLDADPAIKAAYLGGGASRWGEPTSLVMDVGNHRALRTERVIFQHWTEDVPWARAGEVTLALAGDLAKEAGLLPDRASLEPVGFPGR